MTVRPIRLFGDPVLRTEADPVTSFDRELRQLVTDLEDTVREPGRAGVAAPQIGVSLRVFSYHVEGVVSHLVNPVLSDRRGEQDDEEGCLSVPAEHFPTGRADWARVTGVDADGKPVEVEGRGFLARCLQHETDHLDGLLYIDRLVGRHQRAAKKVLKRNGWGVPGLSWDPATQDAEDA